MQLLRCKKSESTNLIGLCFCNKSVKKLCPEERLFSKWILMPSSLFPSPHLHGGLLETRSLVFLSEETTAFVFHRLRQPPEVRNNSSEPTWQLLLAFLCIFIIASFLPQLCPSEDKTASFLSIQLQEKKKKNKYHRPLKSCVSDYTQTCFSGGVDLRLLDYSTRCRSP